MNKKIKIFLALTLVIQILIPSFLLLNHYSVIKEAKESETEYCFRLIDIYFFYPAGDISADTVISLSYTVEDALYSRDKRMTVSVDETGLAAIASADENSGDCWFDYDYYMKNKEILSSNFTFEPDIDVQALIKELRSQYSWFNRNNENRIYAYVTAKIHKGIFLPTAIYLGDIKILTINID